jgi:hypothetical protein
MRTVYARWRARLAVRRALLASARRRAAYWRARKADAKPHTPAWSHAGAMLGDRERLVAHRKSQVAYAERVVARHRPPKLTATVAFDGVPVFRGHSLMLADARAHGWHGRLNSADRRKGVPERYGKLSQAALYAGWLAHRAGFNPANPPGRSTHELRSDGVAYAGPVGRPLAWWQLGLDASNAEELREVLNRLGYRAFRPYPSGSEAHHLNLKASPTATLRKRGRA